MEESRLHDDYGEEEDLCTRESIFPNGFSSEILLGTRGGGKERGMGIRRFEAAKSIILRKVLSDVLTSLNT